MVPWLFGRRGSHHGAITLSASSIFLPFHLLVRGGGANHGFAMTFRVNCSDPTPFVLLVHSLLMRRLRYNRFGMKFPGSRIFLPLCFLFERRGVHHGFTKALPARRCACGSILYSAHAHTMGANTISAVGVANCSFTFHSADDCGASVVTTRTKTYSTLCHAVIFWLGMPTLSITMWNRSSTTRVSAHVLGVL